MNWSLLIIIAFVLVQFSYSFNSLWKGLDLNNEFAMNTSTPFNIYNSNFQSDISYYVDSNTGSDTLHDGFSASKPFLTLNFTFGIVTHTLKTYNNKINIFVYLNGTFFLSQTITITNTILASSYHLLITSLDQNQPALISGGILLPSQWELYDVKSNIYRLHLSSTNVNGRNLYVNGNRIQRVKRNSDMKIDCAESIFVEGISYPTDATTYQNSTVNLNETACDNLVSSIAYVEDSLTFLTLPNTWMSNQLDDGYIYMIPPSINFDLNDVEIILPQLLQILFLQNITNIAFSHLRFEHNNMETFNFSSVLESSILSAVHCQTCTNVSFFLNTFAHLGTSGLRIGENSINTMIWFNTIRDISASGLQIGSIFSSISSRPFLTMVQDNTIRNWGVEFVGSYGVASGFFALNTTYSHNDFLFD